MSLKFVSTSPLPQRWHQMFTCASRAPRRYTPLSPQGEVVLHDRPTFGIGVEGAVVLEPLVRLHVWLAGETPVDHEREVLEVLLRGEVVVLALHVRWFVGAQPDGAIRDFPHAIETCRMIPVGPSLAIEERREATWDWVGSECDAETQHECNDGYAGDGAFHFSASSRSSFSAASTSNSPEPCAQRALTTS